MWRPRPTAASAPAARSTASEKARERLDRGSPAHQAILPPSSSSMWTRMISSKLVLGLEAQLAAALGLEVPRPAGDDLHDRLVGLAPDAGHHLVARHLAQAPRSVRPPCRRRRAASRCGGCRARPCPSSRHGCRKPIAARGLACQWRTSSGTGSTASWPASGSRMMLEKKPDAARLGLPGRTQTVGKRRPDAIEEAAARIVRQQQFADRLLGAVAGERRGEDTRPEWPPGRVRRTPRWRR